MNGLRKTIGVAYFFFFLSWIAFILHVKRKRKPKKKKNPLSFYKLLFTNEFILTFLSIPFRADIICFLVLPLNTI